MMYVYLCNIPGCETGQKATKLTRRDQRHSNVRPLETGENVYNRKREKPVAMWGRSQPEIVCVELFVFNEN